MIISEQSQAHPILVITFIHSRKVQHNCQMVGFSEPNLIFQEKPELGLEAKVYKVIE